MMTDIRRRLWTWLFLAASGGTLFQAEMACTGTGAGGYFGFNRFATNAAGGVIDWCSVLDCENGSFGGLVDPCNDPVAGPWLLDCPNAGGDTTNGDGTAGTGDGSTNGTTGGGGGGGGGSTTGSTTTGSSSSTTTTTIIDMFTIWIPI